MTYRIIVPKRVQKQINKLPRQIRLRIYARFGELEQDPRPKDCLKLEGTDNEYRIRVSSYRVTVIAAKHRKDIYKD